MLISSIILIPFLRFLLSFFHIFEFEYFDIDYIIPTPMPMPMRIASDSGVLIDKYFFVEEERAKSYERKHGGKFVQVQD